MFREEIKSDIKDKLNEIEELARNELGIDFKINGIVFHGATVGSEDLDLIDICLEYKINVYNSDDKYNEYYFDNYSPEIAELEPSDVNEQYAREVIHDFFQSRGLKYKDVKLNIISNLKYFEDYALPAYNDELFEEIDDYLNRNRDIRKGKLVNEMENSTTELNVYNSMEAREKFIELANSQLAKPEDYMKKLQRTIVGGGVMQPMIEHIGDLTHRMSQKCYIEGEPDVDRAINDIKVDKIEMGLRRLKHPYGFVKEFEENIRNNFEHAYSTDTKISSFSSLEEYREAIINGLVEYSRLHSELKVYNQAQYYAREAAVNLGKMEIEKTIHCLEKLNDMIESEEFFKEASKYDPDFELKFKPDVVTLYHGSNEYFQEVDPARLGEKITSLGRGFYLTPNYEKAKSYGDKIMEFNVDMQDVLDWGNLTIPQRLRIEKALLEVVPEERIAGFGEKVEVTVPANEEGIVKYKELKHKTKHYYHEAARAQTTYNEDDTITISYRKASNLKLANNQQLMTLMNEYRPELAKELGFKCAKFSDEISVYDLSLVKYNSVLEDNIKNTIAKKKKVLSSQKIGNP